MKKEFSSFNLSGKQYPSVIMGEDKFTGWWAGQKKYSEKERARDYLQTLEIAYSMGVRGFSISPNSTLIKVLRKFKKQHQEIVCISNHHWYANYYLGDKSLWENETLKKVVASDKFYCDQGVIKDSEWFKDINAKDRLTKKEIDSIRLDEKEYRKQLRKFSFCDFFLVGNFGRTSLLLLGRKDIIEREIELIRESGLIPIGMCEGGGLALLDYEKMDVAGTWVWINRHTACPNLDYALEIIKKAKRPIIAYRVLESPDGFDLKKSISFIKTIPQIKSIVIGVENKEQAEETFSELHKYWD